MSEKIFTKEQQSAIETRDKTLLVSAAAGSGKTATLTERIIRSLLDSEHPVDISELLIVTFTNAAVAEMRERIRAALTDAVARHPEDRRLEKQLYLLPAANILTIDAFCNRILRECTAEAGLPPNYRIADETESGLLARTMIEDLMESVYDKTFADALSPERFSDLCNCLTEARTDKHLGEIFYSVYRKLESTERGIDGVADAAAAYAPFSAVEETRAGSEILRLTQKMLRHYATAYATYLDAFASDESKGAKKYIDRLTPERDALLRAAGMTSYTEMRRALAEITFETLPPVAKAEKTDTHLYAKHTRDSLKDDLQKIRNRYFSYTEDEWRTLFSEMRPRVETLIAFLTRFDGLFRAEKRRRGIAEYADIERYTCDALWHGGEKTPFAASVAARFRAVYIDEFQDVSPLQAHIFDAVVREDNCFFVGDIKQSIYRFRGADPTVFTRAKESYPPLDEAGDSPRATVFMSKNFRSDPGVIDFVNGVFDPTFSLLGDSIGYRTEDRLTLGKGGDHPYQKAEILLVELPKKGRADTATAEEGSAPGAEDDSPAAKELEAAAVADAVRRLLDEGTRSDGSRVRPSDIAILFRDLSGNAEVYAASLAARGIECEVPDKKNFFFNADILLVLSLLNVIDNPRKDIYLAGLLCSPLFGFTADELFAIRRDGTGRSLYDALQSYVKCNEEFTKGRIFLKTLTHFRDMSEGVGIDRFLSRLYAETGIEAIAAKHGSTDNLRLFYEYARRFEASSFHGLYGFLHYVNQLIETGAKIDTGRIDDRAERVRLLTIHASKGLEYPICFLANAGAVFRYRDASAPILLDSELGPVFRLSDPEGLVTLNTPVKALAEDRLRRAELEENLRILYVALTRAKERLFITGRPSKKSGDVEAYLELMRIEKECATPYSAAKRGSFLDFILASGADANVSILHPAEKTSDADFATEKPVCAGERTGVVQVGADDNKIASTDDGSIDAGKGEDARVENCEKSGTDTTAGAGGDKPIGAGKGEAKACDREETVCATSREAKIKDDAKGFFPHSDEEKVKLYLDRFSYRYPGEVFTRIPAKLSVSLLSPSVLDGSEEEEERLTIVGEREKTKEIEGDLQTKLGILPKFITGTDPRESAKRGIATHHFLQFCDFEKLANTDTDTELARLVREKYLTKEDERLVRRDELSLFSTSDLFDDFLAAKKIYREFRFHAKLPARGFTTDPSLAASLGDEVLLIQGVMDAVFIDRDGALCLVDYKTDRLPKNALSDETVARDFLLEKHTRQLSYYAAAIFKIFGKYPDRVGIYSLPLGKTLSVPIKRTFDSDNLPMQKA